MINLEVGQQHIHWAFGIRTDFSQVRDPARAVHLLRQHDLVIIDSVPWTQDQDQLWNFARAMGEPCDPVVLEQVEGYALPSFGWHRPQVEKIYKQVQSQHDEATIVETWHQDSAYYRVEQTISMATVDLSDLNPGEKTCDTAFSTMRVALDGFSPKMKDFLTTLQVRHTYKRRAWTDSILAEVMQRYLGHKTVVEIQDIVHDIKRRMPEPTVQPLVQTAWGRQHLVFSLNSDIDFPDLEPNESQALVALITQSLVRPEYQYFHRWQPDQLVLWNNQGLMHTIVRNSTQQTVRKLHRVQVRI